MKYNVISISLDEGTRQGLLSRLKQLGMTRSEYVRSLLRKDGVEVSRATPKPKAKTQRKGAKV